MTSNNGDCLVWNFDFALTTFYEVDAFQLESLIPPQLSLQEAAPGVGLINVTAFNFVKGQLGALPEFQELILMLEKKVKLVMMKIKFLFQKLIKLKNKILIFKDQYQLMLC